jgi:hypothetical protein
MHGGKAAGRLREKPGDRSPSVQPLYVLVDAESRSQNFKLGFHTYLFETRSRPCTGMVTTGAGHCTDFGLRCCNGGSLRLRAQPSD